VERACEELQARYFLCSMSLILKVATIFSTICDYFFDETHSPTALFSNSTGFLGVEMKRASAYQADGEQIFISKITPSRIRLEKIDFPCLPETIL